MLSSCHQNKRQNGETSNDSGTRYLSDHLIRERTQTTYREERTRDSHACKRSTIISVSLQNSWIPSKIVSILYTAMYEFVISF